MVQDLIQPTDSNFSQIGPLVCQAKVNGRTKTVAMLDLQAEQKMRNFELECVGIQSNSANL